jgi:hypothetical protein
LQARCQHNKIEPSISKSKAVKLNQVGGELMKRWIPILIVVGILLLASTGVGAGPEIIYRDGKISVNADNVPLGDLLRLWDQATGMQSSVPPELSGYTLSAHFTNLNINDAARRILGGQPFGYALMQGRGIIVTGPANEAAETEAAPEPIDINATEAVETYDGSQIQRMKPEIATPDPVVIPTPFGPVVSPSGYVPPMLQLPPVPTAPPPPPFFLPQILPTPPAGAANGPVDNMLFGPLSIHP